MSINLLWLLPIIAFAAFVFLVAYFAQRRKYQIHDPLAAEVHQFNTGRLPQQSALAGSDIAQTRLAEIEGKISTLTGSLSGQRAILEKFQNEAAAQTSEITDLRKRLSELHKEYDLVLSENYSLRARIKLLSKKLEMHQQLSAGAMPALVEEISLGSSTGRTNAGSDPRLFDDTRIMNALQPDPAD